MKCVICNAYYRQSEFNLSEFCESCVDTSDKSSSEDLMENFTREEFTDIIYPSSRTKPVFYD